MICIYRSPSCDATLFTQSLHEYIKLVNAKNILAIVGVFNLCMRKYFTSVKVESLYDGLLENGFHPVIQTSTRSANETNSIIDQIFLNCHFLNGSTKVVSGNVFAGVTDHNLQYLNMKFDDCKIKETVQPLTRIYNERNINAFVKELESLKFCATDNAPLDEVYDEYDKLVSDVFERAFPLRKVSRKMLKSKDWFNEDCMAAFKKKKKLYKRFYRTKSHEDKEAHDKFNR